jgi:AcrR family transcriptional regulator
MLTATAPTSLPASDRRLAATTTALPDGALPAGPRGTLLNAALRLFAEHGFAGASMRDIAGAVGVQAATIYAHYPSKEQLLAELIRIAHEEHQRRLRQAMLESSSDPREQLIAYVRAHVKMHCELPMLAIVANSDLHVLSKELAAPSHALREQSGQLLVEVVERGRKAGVFQVAHSWLAVAAIGGMGLRVAYWYTPEFELSADRVAEHYAEFACRIVGAVHAGPGSA